MTEKERFGSLSKTLIDFLYLNEDQRKKQSGSGVYKNYERIVKHVDYSFQHATIAYIHLPEKYRDKLDLITNYEGMLKEIKRKKITKNQPDKSISSVIAELEFIRDREGLDPKLKKLARKDFDKVIDWLRYLEPKRIGTTKGT